MGVKRIALALIVVAALCGLAELGMAIELGELQAVPGSHPPYLFRLAIVPSPWGSSDLPAVTVRQPHDALSVVKNNHLELRLPSLTDVELEVKRGGQTFNRLWLKSELQAARTQLETVTVASRPWSAPTKGHASPAAAAGPLATATTGTPDRALLEGEIQALRREIQHLVAGVTPWEGLSPRAWHREERAASSVLTLMLWGWLSVGVASLLTGYLMQRRAVSRARQRRRALVASRRWPRGELSAGAPIRHAGQRAQRAWGQIEVLGPVTVLRHVRVSQRTRRRPRVWASSLTHDTAQDGATGHLRVAARVSHPRPAAPAEVIEALSQLRRELIRLQQQLTSTQPQSPASAMRRAGR
jgi:hypothetical protein